MSALIFPLAAIALVFVLVMPAATLAARALLARRRARTDRWSDFGSDSTFALLIAPTVLPLVWLASSAMHHSEPARALESCLIDHFGADACIDAIVLLGILMTGVFVMLARQAWLGRALSLGTPVAPTHPFQRRIDALLQGDGALSKWRVTVSQGAPAPAFAHGLLRPRLVLDACFVEDNADDILRAALLHEAAHADARDPLRFFLARLCLALNPAGALLQPDFGRWCHAREALCDSEAVAEGGDPLALAEGLVRAARFQCRAAAALHPIAAICGHDAKALHLRVTLLMDGPSPPLKTRGHAVLLLAILAAIALPHAGPSALDDFHFAIEHLLLFSSPF